jgi:hypothetical protein
MYRVIDRLKLIFLAIFACASLAVFVYHYFWVWPGERCEAKGDWWDASGRVCATPVLISDITGRTIPEKRAETAAVAAAKR